MRPYTCRHPTRRHRELVPRRRIGQRRRDQLIADCTTEELKAAGITCSDDDPEYPDNFETVYWTSDGAELSEGDRVFIPGRDPIPHYQRGRTYIEPRMHDRAA